MKTLKITPRKEEDFEELAALLEDIDLIGKMEIEEVDKPPFRRLTPQDMAFGIGRPATDEELMEYLTRPRMGKPRPLEDVILDIKKRLKENRNKKAS